MLRINNLMYRYDNKVYQPGDIIEGPTRVINQIIIDTYSRMTGFDFSKSFVYANPTRDKDNSWHESYYVYEVIPIGDYVIGDDTYSIDICNDQYKKRFKTVNPSESSISKLAVDMCSKYIDNASNTSVIAHSFKVVKRIHIGGENDEGSRK